MKIIKTKIEGVFLLEIEPVRDERGYFARTWCKKECEAAGITTTFVQSSISYNTKKGTLRGMHYQAAPHEEEKLVQCLKGAIYDVALDIRLASKTYLSWVAFELNEKNKSMIFIPKGVAHGFQTLEDNTELAYSISEYYQQGASRGMPWNDKKYNIHWPLPVSLISNKDSSYKGIYL